MAWTVDPGLEVLLAQINAAAPNRSKLSDGSIGDPAHAATASDHNPESPPPAGNPDDEVDARDFTHDPSHGADMHVVTEAIRLSRDPRVLYVIWNRRSYSGASGTQPWVWRPYYGDNPHDKHAHVSVRDVNRGTQLWSIGIGDDMDLYDSKSTAKGLAGRSHGQMLDDLFSEVINGRSHNDGKSWNTAGKLAEIAAAVKTPAGLDYTLLADAIVAKLPATSLTAADVRAALADVLRHGVATEVP